MSQSDDLRHRVMKELVGPHSFQWNVRESYATVAKRLGVDEETVKRRMKSLQQFGLFQGWQIVLNPHLIGKESSSILLEVDNEERKAKAISEIKLVEGVVYIFDFHGRGLQLVVYYENDQELERKMRLLSSICGSSEPSMYWKGGLPPSHLKLKNTDWKIIKAMRKGPRRNLSDIAKEAGVSTKTVRRRLALMTDGNAFSLVPKLNIMRAPGVNCRFITFCPDENKKKAADEMIRSKLEKIVVAFTSAKEHSAYTVLCDNVSEAEGIQKWMKGLDGVQEVRMGIIREMMVVTDWLDIEIEKRLLESQRN